MSRNSHLLSLRSAYYVPFNTKQRSTALAPPKRCSPISSERCSPISSGLVLLWFEVEQDVKRKMRGREVERRRREAARNKEAAVSAMSRRIRYTHRHKKAYATSVPHTHRALGSEIPQLVSKLSRVHGLRKRGRKRGSSLSNEFTFRGGRECRGTCPKQPLPAAVGSSLLACASPSLARHLVTVFFRVLAFPIPPLPYIPYPAASRLFFAFAPDR